MECFRFAVNGLEIDARFSRKDRDEVLLPLLRRLSEMQREGGGRLIVFIAAPPAAGKSTLCCYLERLSREYEDLTPLQCAGLDGFHYPQDYLDSHSVCRGGETVPLARIKGAPESFDVRALSEKIEAAREGDVCFPVYDRRLHDPVEDALSVTEKILVIEGNWLLLDESPWNALSCDYSLFLACGGEENLKRIVRRKMMGGYSEAEARRMVRENDRFNIIRCLEGSRRGDLNLTYNENNELEEI